jgi:hypothetical protein
VPESFDEPEININNYYNQLYIDTVKEHQNYYDNKTYINSNSKTLDTRVFNDIYKIIKLSSHSFQHDNSHLFDLFKRLLDLIYETAQKENSNEFISFEEKIITIYSKFFFLRDFDYTFRLIDQNLFNFSFKFKKEILKEKRPSFSLGKCQRALREYFKETLQTQSYKHLYETIKIYSHKKHLDLDEPHLKIFISLSPQIYPHVRVAFDIFNHLVYVTLKYSKHSNNEEVYEEISRLALINFLDDESLQRNANKLMFNSLSEIKEAFCGLYLFIFYMIKYTLKFKIFGTKIMPNQQARYIKG